MDLTIRPARVRATKQGETKIQRYKNPPQFDWQPCCIIGLGLAARLCTKRSHKNGPNPFKHEWQYHTNPFINFFNPPPRLLFPSKNYLAAVFSCCWIFLETMWWGPWHSRRDRTRFIYWKTHKFRGWLAPFLPKTTLGKHLGLKFVPSCMVFFLWHVPWLLSDR